MYKKIVVSLSLDHGLGVRALDVARKLLDEGGEIIAVHVLEPIPKFASYYLEPGQEDKILTMAKEGVAERIGEKKDVEAVVLVGHPGRLISEYAAKIKADCIIAGSHKPGMKDFLLGSTAARIVRHAPCSVHVLRTK